MTSQATERRARRAEAEQVFDELALDYRHVAGVSRSRMFGGVGLLVNGKLFAFVGRDGRLVLKLPAPQAAAVVAGGEAVAVRVGRNTTREWVSIPLPPNDDRAYRWRDLMAEAYRYVLSHTLSSQAEP